ncbi:MarR family transcriptional regulator [Aerococcaceae bacterium DSM 111176]|nr:MarR family transcriptional regulator [Aerococcaceae bacterium DSM 111176]
MKKKHYKQLIEGLELAKTITSTLPALPDSIKPSYLYVLNSVVSAENSMRIKDISEDLTIASPNVSALVNEMAKLNLVIRETLPEDKRVTFIIPTDEGRKLLETYYTSFHTQIIDSIDLKKSDVKQVISTLNHLKEVVEDTVDSINEQNKNENA